MSRWFRADHLTASLIACFAMLFTWPLSVLGDSTGRADVIEQIAVPGAGVLLAGHLYRPLLTSRNAPAMLLLQGGGAGGMQNLELPARALSERGYVVLVLTMRGFPGSEGKDDCGFHQADDAVAALRWLAQRPGVDGSRLGMIGFSRGAQVALLAAARTELPRAVIAYFPITDVELWRETTAYDSVRDYIAKVCDRQGFRTVSPLYKADDIKAPVMLIHGLADDRVPVEQSELMHDALRYIGKRSELRLLPDVGHDLTPEEFEESWPSVLSFLRKYQVMSLDGRSVEQQRRVNAFANKGWTMRMGRSINGIRSLGKVKREKVSTAQNPHFPERTDEIREFFFYGLYVKALFPGRKHDAFLLQEMEISKPHHKVRYGLGVGSSKAEMEEKLGQSDGKREDFVEYFHSLGTGTARVYFEGERVARIHWDFE